MRPRACTVPCALVAPPQELLRLADAMVAGSPVTSSVRPPDLQPDQISLLAPVVVDWVPRGATFGEVTSQPQVLRPYVPGQGVVEAVFRCVPAGGRAEVCAVGKGGGCHARRAWVDVCGVGAASTRLIAPTVADNPPPHPLPLPLPAQDQGPPAPAPCNKSLCMHARDG